MRRTRVYVAGPYSKGDVAVNVRNAVLAGTLLWEAGYAPFVPHLTHFWHMLSPMDYEQWLALDNEWLPCCDAVLRLPGDSSGADKEVSLAESLGIPVYTNTAALLEGCPPRMKYTFKEAFNEIRRRNQAEGT